MLFTGKMRGIWRDGDYICIRGEYRPVRFHIHEICSIEIADRDGAAYPLSALPLRRAYAIFTLKSGRQRRLACGRLTMRRYRWLLGLIEIEKHPEIKAAML